MIYGVVLLLHSVVRWAVVVLGLWVVVRSVQGLSSGSYSNTDRKLATLFVSAIHFNVLVGILMWAALSPIVQASFADMGGAMKNSGMRFFLLEHPFGMLVGTVVATIGSARVKRTSDERLKHRRGLIFYGLGLLLILASVPWPFYPAGRPLFWFAF